MFLVAWRCEPLSHGLPQGPKIPTSKPPGTFWQKTGLNVFTERKNSLKLTDFLPWKHRNSVKCFQNVFTEAIDIKKTANISGFEHFGNYSNSIVPGGLLVRSYITRLTPRTSLIIRDITLFNTSYGIWADSAVIKSIVLTARKAMA